MSDKIEISRKELYEKVWSSPLTHIAKEFGISDVAVKDICKKLNVPTPEVGYWQKLKFNKPVKKLLLPPVSDDFTSTYTIDSSLPKSKIRKPVFAVDYKRIQVPAKLKNPHRLIEGIFTRHYGDDRIFINVSTALKDRALRIMDTLIKELESRGCKVRNDMRKNFIKYGEFEIEFRLTERTKRIPAEKTQYSWNKYQFINTGDLVLKIYPWYHSESIRQRFEDSEKAKVEDLLDDFIHYVFIAFDILKEIERKRQENEKERKRIAQIKLEEELKIKAEKEKLERKRIEKENRIKLLESYAYDFKKSQVIMDFIEKVKAAYAGNKEFETQLGHWTTWAIKVAKNLNPLTSDDFMQHLAEFTYPDEE